MNFLEECRFTNKQIKELEANIPSTIKKTLIENKKLVTANLKYLIDLGVTNAYNIFSNYYDMFLMDYSNFVEIFNKYEESDLIDKLNKNVAIIEYL